MTVENPAAPTEQAAGGAASTEQATATEGTTTVTDAAAKAASVGESTGVETPVVPETYDLKAPEGSALDDAAIERTAATARELGLSQEHAQKALDFVASEVKTRVESAVEAARADLLKSYAPGGEAWQEQVDGWKAEALKDASLGKTEADRTAAIQRGQAVLQKFAEAQPEDAESTKQFLNISGLGNHPAVVRFFSWLGKAAGEAQMVTPGAAGGGEKSTAELLYGSSASTQ